MNSTITLIDLLHDYPDLLSRPIDDALQIIQSRNTQRVDGLSGGITMREFYVKKYLPEVSQANDVDPDTIRCREKALSYWEKLTRNPPLREIDKSIVLQFVTALRQQPSRYGGKIKQDTVHKHCMALASILNYAGPACYKYPDAIGLIPTPPKFKTVKSKGNPTAKTPTMTEFSRILKTCLTMDIKYPILPDITPNQWWFCLYMFLYNTGLRKGDVLNVAKWQMIRIEDEYVSVLIPADHEKEGNEKNVPLNSKILKIMELLPRNPKHSDQFIFYWPMSKTTFYRTQERIVRNAGVKNCRGTCHACRRLLATNLEIGAARSVLHHVDDSVTRNNYQSLVANARALETLRQPILD